ncbi:energy transducer TonB [Sphingopyxis sp. CCNWLW253]|uniref:energy transducer TonB n=1 Tax=unclassified Sphingopyxis TaxID=2614943 RepID=UPI003012D4F3
MTAPASLSATEPAPEARWEVNAGKTKCRLIRHFTLSGQKYRLELAQGWSFGGYDWTLYGGALPTYSSATSITIALDPPAPTHRFKTNPHMFYADDERGIGWHDTDSRLFNALRDNQHIRITGAKKLDVALDLPNASNALKALEACENGLFTSWGIDAKQFRSLTARAEPSNYPGRWATTDDYPQADFARKNEGMTTFLLPVGPDGKVSDCRIVDSSGFPSLDQRTCELMLARAAFRAAKDGNGRAVSSFYINKVYWKVPR